MKKNTDIKVYNDFLMKTFDYILNQSTHSSQLHPLIVETYLGFKNEVTDAFLKNDVKKMGQMVNSIIPDMLDDVDYLGFVKEFGEKFPVLSKGTRKVLKQVVKRGKISNVQEFEIVSAALSYVNSPQFETISRVDLERIIFEFETQNHNGG